MLFVNYLPIVLEDEDRVVGIGARDLARHADAVQAGLDASQGNAKVRRKMLWLVDYHNYICDEFLFIPSLKISTPDSPRRRKASVLATPLAGGRRRLIAIAKRRAARDLAKRRAATRRSRIDQPTQLKPACPNSQIPSMLD